MMPRKKLQQKVMEEERRQLMADHGTFITDGLATVERTKKGLLVDIDGIKFDIPVKVGEELMASLNRALRPFAGFSVFDEIMMNLDAVIDRLMAGPDGQAEDGRDPGRAEAFTMALAIIRQCGKPDFQGEKERQMERYQKRMSGEADNEIRRIEHRRSKQEGLDGFMPEPEEEVWECGECGAEFASEEEANGCAKQDAEEEE